MIDKGALSLALAMCASAATAEDVTIWAWGPDFNIPIMERAAERYQAKNPDVTFDIISLSKSDVENKLQVGLISGIDSSLPDITLISDHRAQAYMAGFEGTFADLTDRIDFSEFAPYKVRITSLGDRVYGVPFDSGVAETYFRRDYLEAAGFTPDDLEGITWQRFIEIGQQVEAATGHKMMSIYPEWPNLIMIMTMSGGEWFFDEEDELYITENPALRESLLTLKALYDSGITAPSSGWDNWVSQFTSGDVATVTSASWLMSSVQIAEDQSGKWGVAPIPRLDIEGGTHFSDNGGSSWYVLDNRENTDVAIDFLNEIWASDKEFYDGILEEMGAIGTWLPAQSGGVWDEPLDFFGGQAVYADMANWIREVPAVNIGMNTTEVSAAINSALPAFLSGDVDIDATLMAIEGQARNQIQ